MRLTTRGRTLAAVIVVGMVMSWLFGPRTIVALVVPAAIGIGAAAIELSRVEEPSVTRIAPDDGHVGITASVVISIETNVDLPATIEDSVDDGLATDGNVVRTTLDEGGYEYELTYARRGRYGIGPLTITVRDQLGLLTRQFSYFDTDHLTVYPPVYTLMGTSRHELNLLPETTVSRHRGEFDRLREYERGDSLRDVHWKSSAKRADGDLVVKAFVDQDDEGSVEIAAEGARNASDQLMTATASVACYLLSAGVPVGLNLPDDHVEPGHGAEQRTAILDALAMADAGTLSPAERDRADILVSGDETLENVVVAMDDRSTTFGRLLGTNEHDRSELTPAAVRTL